MILLCTCTHPAQDQIHGKGKRVHNLCKHDTAIRCTVCGHEAALSNTQVKDIKKGGQKK